MTHEEIDIMWHQAMRESIKDGEVYTRYHFAKLVAAKAFQNGYVKGVAAFNDAVLLEREACAKECWKQMGLLPTQAWTVNPYEQCIDAIRARGA